MKRSRAKSGVVGVVLLAGVLPWPGSANRDRALRAGARAFFQKPVDNEEVLAAIRAALQNLGAGNDIHFRMIVRVTGTLCKKIRT